MNRGPRDDEVSCCDWLKQPTKYVRRLAFLAGCASFPVTPDLPNPPDLDTGWTLEAWMALPPEARSDAYWSCQVRALRQEARRLRDDAQRMRLRLDALEAGRTSQEKRNA